MSKIFRGSPTYYEEVKGVTFGSEPLDFLSLNLPPLCNYHCDFCFASGGSENQISQATIKNNSLTGEEYTKIIREAKDLGVRHIEISGEGEPDLPVFRRTLSHIVNQATENEIHTTVFVNGSWLDKNLAHFISERDASLAVSIKYMDENKYDRAVAFPGAHRKVMNNINVAREIIGDPIEENGATIHRLALFGAVLDDNYSDNQRLREFCDERNLFFSLSTRIPQGRSEGALINYPQQESVVSEFSHGTMILADSSKTEVGFPVCGTFYYGLGINYDGTVVFDAHTNDMKIGNIKDMELSKAVKVQREMRNHFYQEEGSQSYCPLRDPEKYANLVQHYGGGKER